MPEQLDKIKEHGNKIGLTARQQMLTYIISALALVAGLAWNEAIKSAIDYLFPLSKDGVWPKLIYAVLVTLLVVLVTLILSHFLGKKEEK